ncbi:tetratricopeptide (TPR) repeat protein/rubredoxin [Actinoplanes tereljensis]|uniref:TIR domain-containing protein n=1 Tax=Paractinoplanes tereljensis TaxID=571912 RepID=A0A919TTM2_9ACTN|nr:toll/interleukin-1 receptor domain-containing protein [Actinoplanes tereljensis]GIF20152.1 hypothetical protein Ate02nite_28820 [Actinoplanes tereljensis]
MTDSDSARRPIYRFPLTGAAETLDDLVGTAPRPRPRIEAAAKRAGSLRLRRAALWSAVRELQDRPRTAGYPPRIFVSYRWEDEAVQQWCRRLTAHLRDRGYEVLLDLENLEEDLGPAGVNIAGYVARLVDVQAVLRIITRPYVDGLAREWLLAEDQLMKLMAETGCAIGHVLLRDGTEPPDWGRHGTVDLRDAPEDFTRLDAILAPYRGLALPAAAEEDLVELLIRSRDLLAAERPAEVAGLLARRPDLAGTFEVRQTLAHAWLAQGRLREAAEVALSIEGLPGRPTVETTVDVALILEEAGLPHDALRLITKVILLPTALQPRIRRVAGSLLEDLGAPDAALRQLRWALGQPETAKDPKLGSDLHNMIGHVLLFALGDATAALPHFAAGAALDPDNQHLVTNQLVGLMTAGHTGEARRLAAGWQRRPGLIPPLHRIVEAIEQGVDVRAPSVRTGPRAATHVCTDCGAAYRLDPGTVLCAVCAATSTAARKCPYCASSRWSLAGCPTCHQGEIVRRPGAQLW